MDHNSEFGFVTMEKPHTLRSFAAYADWMKALHFSDPPPKVCSNLQPAAIELLCPAQACAVMQGLTAASSAKAVTPSHHALACCDCSQVFVLL